MSIVFAMLKSCENKNHFRIHLCHIVSEWNQRSVAFGVRAMAITNWWLCTFILMEKVLERYTERSERDRSNMREKKKWKREQESQEWEKSELKCIILKGSDMFFGSLLFHFLFGCCVSLYTFSSKYFRHMPC